MYTATQNPLLEFLTMAAAIAAGFVFVYDSRSPVANASFLSRCAAMLAVVFITASVLDRLLVWFSPVFNGANSAAAALEFVGGVLLLGGLGAAILVLRGDLKVRFERPMGSPPMQTRLDYTPGYSPTPESSSASACALCGSQLKPDATFCTNCGARTQAIA